jgi:hypothetical protein
MWAWLAQSGKEKCDYPLLRELKYTEYTSMCPLCTYDKEMKTDEESCRCLKCPMYGRWVSKNGESVRRCDSPVHEGLWIDWCRALLPGTKKLCAGIIAGSLWKRYKELGG